MMITKWLLILLGSYLVAGKSCRVLNNYDKCSYGCLESVENPNTVKVRFSDNIETIILDGIGIPEPLSEFADVSKSYLEYILKMYDSTNLRVVTRTNSSEPTQLRGIIYAGKRNINKKMLTDGYACVPPDAGRWYHKKMEKAVYKGRGMWLDGGKYCFSTCVSDLQNYKFSSPAICELASDVSSNGVLVDSREENYTASVVTTNNNLYHQDKGLLGVPVSIDRVIDGDTLKLTRQDQDGVTIRLRMSYIDAPELQMRGGPEATSHLQQLVKLVSNESTDVRLLSAGKDAYRRTLGVLMVDNVEINLQMVQDGHAWCYRLRRCPQKYRDAMKEAQENRRGLFADSQKPEMPWSWRKKNRGGSKGKGLF